MKFWCTITRVQKLWNTSTNTKLHPISMCSDEWTFLWTHKTWSSGRRDTHVTMHIHPMSTPRTYQHFDKVNTWTSKEIFNSHIVFLVIWNNIVNSSIHRWKDINRWEIVHWVSKLLTSQLLVWCCVILKVEGHFTFLPPQVVGQQLASVGHTMLWTLIASTCKLLGLDDWEPNKLWTWLRSKENPTSSRVITSFWVKSIPSWINHPIGIEGLTTIYFPIIPLT